MNRCTNKNCIFAHRFITNDDTRFRLTMLGVAVGSYATTWMVLPIGLSLCTFWDDRRQASHVRRHVKSMEQITDHT